MSLTTFSTALNNTLKKENSITENGAIGYKTSGTKLCDFNFKMSSYRNADESVIIKDFSDAYDENPLLAVKMIFFTGDIRGGMGERRVFNVCLNWLANNYPNIVNNVMELIPEYNRWDAVINLVFNENTRDKAFEIINKTLESDVNCMNINVPVSLLAKWMPSINTSSKSAVYKARVLKNMLKWSDKKYRKTLSSLRKHLHVVEVNMSSNHWNEINYNHVPSKANLLYKEAFIRHDEERRKKYLYDLKNGNAKINSAVAFPYDIIHKYSNLDYCSLINKKDETLEAMWKALPDYINGEGGDTICMMDGSGSMTLNVGKSSITCLEVAQSLAIYFAEKMKGAFNNKFITFSDNPQLVSFNPNWNLYQKINKCAEYCEVANTNIEKAFDLILKTAIHNNLSQEDMPKNLLILSDMEFDRGVTISNYNSRDFNACCKTLFDEINQKFNEKGYKMPRIVFWNICSRTNTVPIQENENGVALISGFSPTIASMVFSAKLDPYEVLVEKLNSERYNPVEEKIKSFI